MRSFVGELAIAEVCPPGRSDVPPCLFAQGPWVRPCGGEGPAPSEHQLRDARPLSLALATPRPGKLVEVAASCPARALRHRFHRTVGRGVTKGAAIVEQVVAARQQDKGKRGLGAEGCLGHGRHGGVALLAGRRQ